MRVRHFRFLFALAIAAPATGQEGDVAALRARVLQLQDTAEIRRLEREHMAARTAEEALTAGFAALHLWELTGEKEHAARSRRYFDRAAAQEPENAWAHYGHALSFEPDIELRPGFLAVDDAFGRALGLNAVSRARRALERAVSLDPTLPGAAGLLAEYAHATWDGAALKLARERLAERARDPDAPVDVLLALARIERDRGEFQAALDAADAAAARGGDSLAAAHLERAAALASLPWQKTAAGAAYEAAVAGADVVLLERLWQEAALLARESERARWQEARTADERRAVLRAFWEIRGALAASSGPERAAEHYRRLNFARHHFRRFGQLGAAPDNALRLEMIDRRFTDQGIIYIRHGHPQRIWDRSGELYTVWYYRDEDGGPLSYHFRTFAGTSGFSRDPILVYRLSCTEPDVALYDPRLRPLTYGCNAARIQSVSATVRRDAERALRSDTDVPDFDRRIPFSFDLYTFRGERGGTDVVTGIGVPLATLRNASPLRFTLALVDTARYSSARTATTAPAPADAGPDALLRASLVLNARPAPALAYRVDVRSQNGRAGATFGGTLAVPDYAGTAPNLSDVVLAEAAADGDFVRGPHRLALAPTQVFPGGRFRVFYELYDVPAGTSWRTEIRVLPARRGLLDRLFGRGDDLALRFESLAPDTPTPTLYELRDVIAPLEPGTYVLRIRLTSPAWPGALERERRFTVPEHQQRRTVG